MAANKKEKSSVATPWKSFPASIVQNVVSDLVHFSAKVVNSNTPAAGIRISDDVKLNLPYVCVRTIGPSLVPLDYIKNAGPPATVAKNLDAVLQGTVHAKFTDVPDDDVTLYNESLAAASHHHEIGLESVGKRLRQIIVQDNDGNDVALTPLTSAGFGALLEKRLEKEIADSDPKTFRYRRRGYLAVGGANPQNVGRHIRSLQRPLWFTAPIADQRLRKALAIHYRGISLRVSPSLLKEYYQWRQRLLDRYGGVIPSTLETRDVEVNFILRMVDDLVNRAATASDQLGRYQEQLPGKEKTSPELPSDLRALLDPSLRYAGWNRALAKRVHLGIVEQKIMVGGKLRNIGVGHQESNRWETAIERALA
jgi:hypothetical protein